MSIPYCNILVVSVVFLLVFLFSLPYPCIVYVNEKQWLDGVSETNAALWYCKGVCNTKEKVLSCGALVLRWSGDVLFLIQPSNDTIFNKKMISGQGSFQTVLLSLKNDYIIHLSYKCWYKKELKLSLAKYSASIFGIVVCCVLSVASITR